MPKPVLKAIDEWYLTVVEFFKVDIATTNPVHISSSYPGFFKGSLSITFIFGTILGHIRPWVLSLNILEILHEGLQSNKSDTLRYTN